MILRCFGSLFFVSFERWLAKCTAKVKAVAIQTAAKEITQDWNKGGSKTFGKLRKQVDHHNVATYVKICDLNSSNMIRCANKANKITYVSNSIHDL